MVWKWGVVDVDRMAQNIVIYILTDQNQHSQDLWDAAVATKPVPGPEHRLNKDNNTSLFCHITGYTEPKSSCRDPEMALQSVWLRSAQPMAHHHGGQVTTYIGAEPITAQMTRTDQNSMGDSHIVPGETNWRPKVRGHFDWEVWFFQMYRGK